MANDSTAPVEGRRAACASGYHHRMDECRLEWGGLSTIAVGDPAADRVVILLHGRMMSASDLAPFAHSLGIAAWFLLPDAPLRDGRGRAWWPQDQEARAQRLAGRAHDLCALDPPGRENARALLAAFCAPLESRRRIVIGGFSQGGMLAMDYLLHGGKVDALALFSSSRIALDDWQPRLSHLARVPVLIAHGRDDQELPFAAGEALRDAALHGGAIVEWLPFDGKHEMPLAVWRALRRFLQRHC